MFVKNNDELREVFQNSPEEFDGALELIRAQAFMHGYSAGKKDRWISVKERMPENGQRVLCFFNPAGLSDVWMYEDSEKEVWLSEYQITYWMPLPEPPKEK